MALRDKLSERAAPFLEPGETVQVAFLAQTTSQWFALLSYWIIIIRNAYRVVVVTNQRILVCQAGRMSAGTIKSVLHTVPRTTRIGPPSGAVWYKTSALGETMYVHRRFWKDIEQADQIAAAGSPQVG